MSKEIISNTNKFFLKKKEDNVICVRDGGH